MRNKKIRGRQSVFCKEELRKASLMRTHLGRDLRNQEYFRQRSRRICEGMKQGRFGGSPGQEGGQQGPEENQQDRYRVRDETWGPRDHTGPGGPPRTCVLTQSGVGNFWRVLSRRVILTCLWKNLSYCCAESRLKRAELETGETSWESTAK